MFSPFPLFASQTSEEIRPSEDIPPPTPVVFPRCTPAPSQLHLSKQTLVSYLQTIHRPADLSIEHLGALNLHVIHDAPPESLLPDPSFLPPQEEWVSIPVSELATLNEETRRPLGNGTKSPGVQTFVDRVGELSIANEAAFRTLRRVPAAPGQPTVRLGYAYEFFKNLELAAAYWDDTSKGPVGAEALNSMDIDTDTEPESQNVETSNKQIRTGTGSSMPNEVRQNLLTSFVKLVSYDFGCNVTIPRLEPRLHLKSQGPNPLHSYFPSTPTFVYRTPFSRQDARAGIVEGPVLALSPRSTTSFPDLAPNEASTTNGTQPIPVSPSTEEVSDLSREIINILTTAQLRSREHQTEVRYGDGKWWTTKRRWGGGVGGPVGREIKEPGPEKVKQKSLETEKTETVIPSTELVAPTESTMTTPTEEAVAMPTETYQSSRTGISSGRDRPDRKKQKIRKKGGQMEIYDAYRMVRPPATNWDRKSRYMAIGKDPNSSFDDIFLISALFHHISVVRCRVGTTYLEALEARGQFVDVQGEESKLVMWRSRWFDLFKSEDRVQAMSLVWGVMGYLMRGEEGKLSNETEG